MNPEPDPSLVKGACYQRLALLTLLLWDCPLDKEGTACGAAGLGVWLLPPCAAHPFLLLPGHGLYCWWDFMCLSQANASRTEKKCNSKAAHSSSSEDNHCSLNLVSSQVEKSLRTFAVFHSFKRTNDKYWALTVGYFRRHTSLNSARVWLLSKKIKQTVNAATIPL